MMVNYKEEIISNYLEELYNNPVCELEYFNDYSLLINIMLSAQTKDSRVNIVTKELYKKYDSLEKLSNANIKDIETIIKSLGNYRKKSNNIIEISKILLNKYDGTVPKDEKILVELPGVGRKTAHVFLAEFYNMPYIAVDTHVDRVSKRLGLAKETDDVLKVEEKLKRFYKKENWKDRHLQMVLFGRYNCTSINPKCDICKLKDICKYYKNKK